MDEITVGLLQSEPEKIVVRLFFADTNEVLVKPIHKMVISNSFLIPEYSLRKLEVQI